MEFEINDLVRLKGRKELLEVMEVSKGCSDRVFLERAIKVVDNMTQEGRNIDESIFSVSITDPDDNTVYIKDINGDTTTWVSESAVERLTNGKAFKTIKHDEVFLSFINKNNSHR